MRMPMGEKYFLDILTFFMKELGAGTPESDIPFLEAIT